MNNIKKFLKSSTIFLIGNFLSRIISFFLLPIYTKNISTSDYGYYDLSITYLTVITSILFFDIWSSVMRFMFDNKEDEKYKYKSIFAGFIIFSISTIIYFIIGIIISKIFDIKYLTLILIYGISLNLQNMFSFISRGFRKNLQFAISGILNILFMGVSSIILILVLKLDYSALYIAGIIGNVIQIIYIEIKIKIIKNIKIKLFDRSIVKEMVKYTLPLCINSVSFWLLTGYNRIVISKVMTVSDNGIYAIGNKFAVIITLITTCFTLAWQEMSFARKINDENNSKFYSKACNIYIKFLGIGIIILIPIISIIFPILIDQSYSQAKLIIPLFLIATVVNAFSNFIGNIFYAQKDTKHIFISALVSALLNVIISYPLIKILGLNGANISILVSFIINIMIRYYILRKNINIKIDLKNIFILSIILLITCFIYYTNNFTITCIWLILSMLALVVIFRKYIYKFYLKIKGKIKK